MRDQSISINSKKIQRFLKDLNKTEFIYLEHHLKFNAQLTHLIEKFKLSKERVCDLFNINQKDYEKLVLGNIEYDTKHMACLNAAYVLLHSELENENIEKQLPVKIAQNV